MYKIKYCRKKIDSLDLIIKDMQKEVIMTVHRQLTENEKKYISYALKERRSLAQVVFVMAVTAIAILIIAGLSLVPEADTLEIIGMGLGLLAGIVLAVSTGRALLTRKEPEPDVFIMQGVLFRKMTNGGLKVSYKLDNMRIELPSHWIMDFPENKKVSLECSAYSKGSFIALRIDETHSIETESAAGITNLKPFMAINVIWMLLTILSLVGIAFFYEKNSPGWSYPAAIAGYIALIAAALVFLVLLIIRRVNYGKIMKAVNASRTASGSRTD